MDIWSYWELFVNAIEVGAVITFLAIQLKIKGNRKGRLVVSGLATLIIVSAMNFIDVQLSFNLFGAITIYISRFISMAAFFLVAMLILEGGVSEKLLNVCLYALVVTFSDFIAFETTRIFTDRTMGELSQIGQERLLVTSVYLFVSLLIYAGIIYIQRKKERTDIHLLGRFRAWLISIMILGTVAIDQLIDIAFFAGDLSERVMEIKTLFISVSFFIILLSVFLLISRVGRMTLDLLRSQHENIMYKNYEELERSYSAIRAAHHDMNNHLRTLNGLHATQSYEELGQYLQGIAGEYTAADTALTGNIPLDVLLTSKLAVAKANDIALHYEARNIETLKIPYTDLCSIVGNLLDNAIEACLKLPEDREKTVHVQIVKKEQMLNLFVENSSDGRYKKQGNTFLSSKNGLMNGMGLKICNATVKRLGGYMYIDAADTSFRVSITFPIDGLNERDGASNA